MLKIQKQQTLKTKRLVRKKLVGWLQWYMEMSVNMKREKEQKEMTTWVSFNLSLSIMELMTQCSHKGQKGNADHMCTMYLCDCCLMISSKVFPLC